MLKWLTPPVYHRGVQNVKVSKCSGRKTILNGSLLKFVHGCDEIRCDLEPAQSENLSKMVKMVQNTICPNFGHNLFSFFLYQSTSTKNAF